MRAPDFWRHGNGGLTGVALAPVGWLYGAAGAIRIATTRPWKAPIPVICIGNLVVGGAGKTPVALDFGARLLERGRTVHFLSRGYGGSEYGPLRVDPASHGSDKVGDEPLLLARLAPTWIAADRRQGCQAAADAGADIIIMDDGFQNPAVAKDLSVIVIDGDYGFGNGRIFPAGPLRESVATGLKRAQGLILIGGDDGPELPHGHPPVLKGRLLGRSESRNLKDKPIIAFAGIGRPEKFFKTLGDIGCDIRATHAFADHYPYNAADLERLRRQAENDGAQLVTTEKDAVRLSPEFQRSIVTVAVTLGWDDEAAINRLLDTVMGK